MLTLGQYRILNACASDWEVFLYIYLESSERSGVAIVSDVCDLVQAGLLSCRRVASDGTRTDPGQVTRSEISIYEGYNCCTLDEHITQLGYGPHEFKISDLGRLELDHPEYRAYDRALGWEAGESKS